MWPEAETLRTSAIISATDPKQTILKIRDKSMKKIDVGQTLAILANIGVIAGIFFLAIEIRQNQASLEEQNTLTRLSGRDTAFEYFSHWRTLLLENPELFDVWYKGRDGEELTSRERRTYRGLCNQYLFMNVALYNRFSALELGGEKLAIVENTAQEFAASENSAMCWNRMNESVRNRGYSEFADLVENSILETG